MQLGEWLSDFASLTGRFVAASWPVLKWVLPAIAIAALLYLAFRLIPPLIEKRRAKQGSGEQWAGEQQASEQWAPGHKYALALLEDADRLADEGRFGEAAHLLLQRSISQIASARPDWLEPSSTAREIAAIPALPDGARIAFSTICERVERSLFALRSLNVEDWQAARDAYAKFALANLPQSRVL